MAAADPNVKQEEDMWRAFFSTYNKLTEKCFVDCVHDFTTKKVSKSETSCSLNCLKKYYEVSHRITQKIGEFEVAKLKEITQ
ncbi:mitochondrial import inner membrane translocase subunit Tim9-like [Mizuhopecten yessoensis]|uniref:mitochondrial import inner membrane translocase subunit Tim9-like n=1 Tax=Mizuhopecten yessoensis TaxID=6573 RepID=UPI000B45A549|nr:mitochondrial import inner membrane translocase subunit Tim9-like [Mizuhopecten yessoensis]XP_021351743.1 mitochondrial import inner membrane translocase subunit Tim9-like [Mizuhopecten yessoensis]